MAATGYEKQFYEKTLPELARNLKRIADALEETNTREKELHSIKKKKLIKEYRELNVTNPSSRIAKMDQLILELEKNKSDENSEV